MPLNYGDLIARTARVEFESGEVRQGRVIGMIQGKVRADYVILQLERVIMSPESIGYPFVAVCPRFGGDILDWKSPKATSCYVLVTKASDVSLQPTSEDGLSLACWADVTFLP